MRPGLIRHYDLTQLFGNGPNREEHGRSGTRELAFPESIVQWITFPNRWLLALIDLKDPLIPRD